MAKQPKPLKPSIPKKDFINFLANATPEQINAYIQEKGKPRKLIQPMYFFLKKQKSSRKI